MRKITEKSPKSAEKCGDADLKPRDPKRTRMMDSPTRCFPLAPLKHES